MGGGGRRGEVRHRDRSGDVWAHVAPSERPCHAADSSRENRHGVTHFEVRGERHAARSDNVRGENDVGFSHAVLGERVTGL